MQPKLVLSASLLRRAAPLCNAPLPRVEEFTWACYLRESLEGYTLSRHDHVYDEINRNRLHWLQDHEPAFDALDAA